MGENKLTKVMFSFRIPANSTWNRGGDGRVNATFTVHSAGVAGAMKMFYLKLVEDQSHTTCEIFSP